MQMPEHRRVPAEGTKTATNLARCKAMGRNIVRGLQAPQPNLSSMREKPTLLERLVDFERHGLTATERFEMRTEAWSTIRQLREANARLQNENKRLRGNAYCTIDYTALRP